MNKHVSVNQFSNGDMVVYISRYTSIRKYSLNTPHRKHRINNFVWSLVIRPRVDIVPYISFWFNFPQK